MRSLVRLGGVGARESSAVGLPEDAIERSRLAWVWAQHPDALPKPALHALARALRQPDPSYAAWSLAQVWQSRPDEVEDVLVEQMTQADPPAAAFAVAHATGMRDLDVREAALRTARDGRGAARSLAFHHLAALAHRAALEILEQVVQDAASATADRAAAALALSLVPIERCDWRGLVVPLLDSEPVQLRRAALRALSRAPEFPAQTVDRVARLLDDPDDDVRYLAWPITRR